MSTLPRHPTIEDQIAAVEAAATKCPCDREALNAAADTLRRADLARATLITAPDVEPARATRSHVHALHAANLAAYDLLAEPAPPSRRGADREPARSRDTRAR